MADGSFDFTAESPADPWTVPAGLTALNSSTWRIVSAATNYLTSLGSGTWHHISKNGLTMGGTVRAGITIHRDSTYNYDPCGPSILNSSGNGYGLSVHGGTIDLFKITGYTSNSTLATVGSQSYSEGALLEIQIVLSTGAITVYNSGSQVTALNTTDTSYTDPDIPCASMLYNNNNSRGVFTLEWTGVAAGGSIPIFAHHLNHNIGSNL